MSKVILFLTVILWLDSNLHTASTTKVIIVGAGAAGLAASEELLKCKDVSTTILEGRDRIGGRVHTDETSFGYPLDLGAILITMEDDNPIVKLAEQNNITLKEFDYSKMDVFIQHMNKKEFSNNDAVKINAHYFINYLKYISENFEKFKEKSFIQIYREYIKSKPTTILQRSCLLYMLPYIQANLTRKVKFFENAIKKVKIGFKDATKMTNQGYQNILKPLGNGKDIKLNTKVVSITHDENKVEVKDSNGNTYSGDYIIVTVPLGVLKSGMIKFSPPLSKEKQDSIKKLEMFDMNKIFVEFENKFWGDFHSMSFIYSEKERVYDLVVNLSVIHDKNCLLFMIAGDIALKYLQEKTEEEIELDIIKLLKTYYPEANIKITKIKMTDWSKDEFTLGSFSEYSADPKYRKPFSVPEGRLIMAGEHSHLTYNSFVYGAYQTGVRAVKQLIKIANLKCGRKLK